jgi:hypothetical protein
VANALDSPGAAHVTTLETPSRRETPGARWVVLVALMLAALLAFGVRGLLTARVTQSRALALL